MLVLRALLVLVSLEPVLLRKQFSAIYDRVRAAPVRRAKHASHDLREVCAAVDTACIWYWKHVLCLQRSAASVLLLRAQGIPAQLVIGAQHMPFKAHAWVEVDGLIVNDVAYTKDLYAVLDRC